MPFAEFSQHRHAAQRGEPAPAARQADSPDADERPRTTSVPAITHVERELEQPPTPPKPWAWLEETSADGKAGSEDSDGLVGR